MSFHAHPQKTELPQPDVTPIERNYYHAPEHLDASPTPPNCATNDDLYPRNTLDDRSTISPPPSRTQSDAPDVLPSDKLQNNNFPKELSLSVIGDILKKMDHVASPIFDPVGWQHAEQNQLQDIAQRLAQICTSPDQQKCLRNSADRISKLYPVSKK